MHRLGVVLRMAAGKHRAVAREQVDALGVHVFVGDDVVGEAARLQPGDQIQVGGEVARRIVQPPGSIRASRFAERRADCCCVLRGYPVRRDG